MNKSNIDNISTKLFEKIPGVYKIKNIQTGVCYIGESKKVYYRLINHKHYLLNNKHENPYLQESFNLYGKEMFEFSVLEYCDKEDLKRKELYYIHLEDECFNVRDVNDTVIHNKRKETSDIVKLKISQANKGKIPINLYDLQQSNRKKIIYYINDDIIQIFNSCIEAADYFNIKPNIFNAYIGKPRKTKKFPKGYKIEYYYD